jgi:hypothetical protein
VDFGLKFSIAQNAEKIKMEEDETRKNSCGGNCEGGEEVGIVNKRRRGFLGGSTKLKKFSVACKE